MKECKSCGALADDTETQCHYCGNTLKTVQDTHNATDKAPPEHHTQNTYDRTTQASAPYASSYRPQPYPPRYRRVDKVTAGVLAILLGGLGIHKFYLGQTGKGILYFLFGFTMIPALLGLVDGIRYLCMDDAAFYEKYARY